jgi:ferredoxin
VESVFKKPAATMTFIVNETDERPVAIKPEGATVLGLAMKNKIPLDSSCLEGTCGSCRVVILEAPSELEHPGEVERETREMRGFQDNERLGCQMIACAGLKVKVPVYD